MNTRALCSRASAPSATCPACATVALRALAQLRRYSALGVALSLTPEQLGALSVARGLTQALVSPITGLLGDAWHRGRIIVVGTLAWAAFSLAFGLCVNYSQVTTHAGRSQVVPVMLACKPAAPPSSSCIACVRRGDVRCNVAQALAFAALSGAGLALVMPCVTAVLSDLYAEEQRGVAFGWILCAAGAGTAAHAGVERQCLFAVSTHLVGKCLMG